MLRNTMKMTLALLMVAVIYTVAPSAGIASQQWNRINLPGKTPAGNVPVIGMSPNFPSDNTIFMADGFTLFESMDGGKNWNDLKVSIPGGRGSTTKIPKARIYVPQNFKSSGLVVLSNEIYEIWYAYMSPGSPAQFTGISLPYSLTDENPPKPGPLPTWIPGYLQGFAFGPDGSMYGASRLILDYGNGNLKNYPFKPDEAGWEKLSYIGDYTYGIKLSPDFNNDKTIIIQNGRRVLMSVDGGKKFTKTSLPMADGYYDMEFSPNYATDGTIAVVVPDVGLFISTDKGASWKNVLPGKSITAAAIGPSGAIYAGSDYSYGTQNGVYVSGDRGRDWQGIGLEGSKISGLYVFKGTDGDLVYAATDSDLAWTTVTQAVPTPEPVDSEVVSGPTSALFFIGQNFYTVDGKTVQMDATPFIENDRAYVPVRYLADALGGEITWDNSTQTVTIKGADTTLQMTIGQAQVTINSNITQIDAAPLLIQDRTFLPARYVAEGLGYQVAWDDKNQAVICWPQEQQMPDVSDAVNRLNGQPRQPLNPPTQQSTENGTWTDITGNGAFNGPHGVAVDSSGNVYVADSWNGKIKKLLNGTWTDITGDGGFLGPGGVAVDSSGNVYVDRFSIRNDDLIKFSNGIWTDITNNGAFGSIAGMAVDSSGNVYVAVPFDKRMINKLVNGTWTDITGNGGFSNPQGVAVDSSGNVYVADSGHYKIKKLTNGTWTDITGDGGFLGPGGVAVDSSGNVYVADFGGNKVKKLANGSVTWTDITGNGDFNQPWGIAVDNSGNVYVTDYLNNKVKKLSR